MWEIYDALIDGIPENLIADEIICGSGYSYVRSGDGSGIASAGLTNSNYNNARAPIFSKNLIGAPLREIATCIKSWNFTEASIGLAAINAYYNNPDTARSNGVLFSDAMRVEDRTFDPFIMSQNKVKNKNVATIGHFPHLESLLEPICNLSIIEWEPEEGDYPIFASEYILPECDYVFIGSSCFIDKSMPRFIELSKNALEITIVGPGTPLAPVLFDYGVCDLSGFIIKDNQRAFRIAAGAERVKMYATGQKVSFKKQ